MRAPKSRNPFYGTVWSWVKVPFWTVMVRPVVKYELCQARFDVPYLGRWCFTPKPMVGARYYDGGQTNEGKIFVYTGGPTGVTGAPAFTWESDQFDGQSRLAPRWSRQLTQPRCLAAFVLALVLRPYFFVH